MITAPRGGILSQWGFLQGMSNELSRAEGNPLLQPVLLLNRVALIGRKAGKVRLPSGTPPDVPAPETPQKRGRLRVVPPAEGTIGTIRITHGRFSLPGVCSGSIDRGAGVFSPGSGRGPFTAGTAAVSSWTIACQVNSSREPRSRMAPMTERRVVLPGRDSPSGACPLRLQRRTARGRKILDAPGIMSYVMISSRLMGSVHGSIKFS